MKLTVEHAIIGVVALALIYFVVQHRNLLNRYHSDLKVVQGKHAVDDIATRVATAAMGDIEQRAHSCGLDKYKTDDAKHYQCGFGSSDITGSEYQPDGDLRGCYWWWWAVKNRGIDQKNWDKDCNLK